MPPDPDERFPETDPRLEIEYPCVWRYRVIGEDPAGLRDAIAAAVADAEHEIGAGNTSSAGRYVSLELAVRVTDDEHRRRIFARLADHAAVRFVL